MGGTYSEYLSPSKVLEHYKYTKETPDTQEIPSRQAAPTVIILLCCAIIAVPRTSKFRSAMHLFLGNLAASQLLAGVAFLANTLLSSPVTLGLTRVQWFSCEGLAFVTLSASVFSLLAIAIERHVAIAKVKLYGSNKSCRLLLLIAASWLISLALGGLPILGWNCLGHQGSCSTVLPLYAEHYVLCVVTIFSVSLLAIVVLSIRIYCVVRSSHAYMAAPQTLALLKTVTIVLGVFTACWLRALSILLRDYACTGRSCPVLYKAHYFFTFATLNSLLNPVIYTWHSRDLQQEVLWPLKCWRGAAGVQGRRDGTPGHRLLALRSSSSLERGTHMPSLPTFLEGNTGV
ncbi:PREDICTED: sphingosine 1-phosphate receptor 2-like [Elephantulus edwardii]|uniref:sphingosine 1-phosphate receptor 2-like n=1 Tax=Elephantulus edwardii TaxID=28737 RepID=UPI0003F083FB|nr:PREDICTED: sphingosine 1-phosphate receptor 2-like [Elephantulus edwardii]